MKNAAPTAALLVVVALVCFVVAGLYATGHLELLTSSGGSHFKHGVLFAGLGVLSLVAANFMRARADA